MGNENTPARGMGEGVERRFAGDFSTFTTATPNHQPRLLGTLRLKPNSDKMEAALKDEANAWDIARRVRGYRPDRNISKSEADRLLTIALAAMKGGAS